MVSQTILEAMKTSKSQAETAKKLGISLIEFRRMKKNEPDVDWRRFLAADLPNEPIRQKLDNRIRDKPFIAHDYYLGYHRRYAEAYRHGAVLWEEASPNEHLISFLNRNGVSHEWNVIDLGCGEGRDSNYMASIGFRNVVGVDISSAAIQKAIDIANTMKLSNVEFVVDDVIRLGKITNAFYDFAINMGCLHMLVKQEHRDSHLRNAFRILRPGGKFLIASCSKNWGHGFRTINWKEMPEKEKLIPGEVIKRRIWKADGSNEQLDLPVVPYKEISREEHEAELMRAGFNILETSEHTTKAFGVTLVILAEKS